MDTEAGFPEEKCVGCSIEKKEDAGANVSLRANGERVFLWLTNEDEKGTLLARAVLSSS
jgi:hypothetical protein